MLRKSWVVVLAGLIAASLAATRTFGWGASRSVSGSNSAGGSFSRSSSTTGGYGNFSHSASGSYTTGGGETYSGSHSGSGTYGNGSADYHGTYSTSTGGSGSYSGTAYRSPTYASSTTYYGYHSTTYVEPSSGSYGAAFGAGVITGAAATAAAQPKTTTVYAYPAAGVYVAPTVVTPTVVVAPAVVTTPVPIGTAVTVLPPGFVSLNVNGAEYFQSGPTWYQMRMGATGAYFVVVTPP